MPETLSSKLAKAREAAKRRRVENREWRRRLIDLLAPGHSPRAIAQKVGASVSTLKRQVQRALAERPPESAETFFALQRTRRDKALQYANLAMESGDLRAVDALVSRLPHVECYRGLQNEFRATRACDGGAQALAPNPLKSLEIATQIPPRAPAPAAS